MMAGRRKVLNAGQTVALLLNPSYLWPINLVYNWRAYWSASECPQFTAADFNPISGMPAIIFNYGSFGGLTRRRVRAHQTKFGQLLASLAFVITICRLAVSSQMICAESAMNLIIISIEWPLNQDSSAMI